MTSELGAAVSGLKSSFGGLRSALQVGVCDILDSLTEGETTWDIIGLHNNAWIHMNYRPACATVGATPPRCSSVQVGTECY